MTPVVQEAKANAKSGNRRQKNEAARRLLKEWLEDTSGYDEQTWPEAKRVLEENSLSVRKRFGD